MELDDYLKSKVRYHLGFNSGAQIPAGDRARLEEAMALVPDELWYNEIVYHVKRCDIAWKASAAIPDDYFDTDGSRIFKPVTSGSDFRRRATDNQYIRPPER